MTGLFESFSTSRDLENKGVWLDLDHSRILLARAGGSNAKYNAAAERIANEHKRVFQLGLMTSQKGKALLHKLYAETVVVDWLTKCNDGTLDEDGNPVSTDYEGARYKRGIGRPGGKIVEFSKANVIETFDLLEDLFLVVKGTAESLTFYRQELIDDIVKN